MLSSLPPERVATTYKGMSKQEVESKYLLAFMDRDDKQIISVQELADLKEKRADLKIKLRSTNDKIKKKDIEAQIQEVSSKINLL